LKSGPLAPGTYALAIEGYWGSQGLYNVSMECQDINSSSFFDWSISCGDARSGDMTGADQHAYFFTVREAMANIEFSTCNSSFATALQITSPDLRTSLMGCSRDCRSCGDRAVLDTGNISAGDYAVVINDPSWWGGGGPYNITMTCYSSTAALEYFEGHLQCGDTLVGDTTGEGSHRGNSASDHIYFFEVDSAGVANIEFDSCGSEFDTHLRVMTPNLQTEIVECDDCGSCDQQTVLDTGGLQPGQYALIIEGYGSHEGSYVVNVTCQNATQHIQYFDGNINCGQSISNTTVDAGSHRGSLAGDHIYYFSIPAGDAVNVEFSSCGSKIDTFLHVYTHDLASEIFGCEPSV
jgi:hypothetical protein